jgi:hypothetical protein
MSPVTVRAVLFGEAGPADAVAGTRGWRAVVDGLGSALSTLSPGGRGVVERELGSALAGLLEIDLGEVLISGWRQHRALVEAAAATRADASAGEVVQLSTHRVTAAHRPYVEVIVNGATIATVGFELGLTLDIDAVLATVRHARLVAVHGGRLTVTAALTAAGWDILSRSATLDPALTVSLGDGIALLPDEAPARGHAAVPGASPNPPRS